MIVTGSRPQSIQDARDMVEKISQDHGYIPDDKLIGIEAGVKQLILDAMLKKDQMIGSSVITLAKNLYSSNARFVFELLQNADDNDFTNAAQSLERPRVSFEIFDTEIVMECNEDGFNMENFAAICDVGKSSKLGAQGYIGEKGIGFKSVFMAAYKVQIQSGQLSFSFNHRQNDSGMGMISPVWEDPDPELSNQVTRVTLFLHDGGSAADVRQRHGQIVQQFREIEGTHLLFLRKVRNIRIKFSHDEKQNEEIEFHIAHTKKSSRATLTKKVDDGVPEHTQYQVFKHTAHHLPRSEDRAYLDLEKNGSTTAPAEIILAFPVDDEGLPIIKTHQVHAFLPIRDMGFKFLLHSDFVTQANRQDIVTTSARNLALVSHIASAFAKAMGALCQDETLQFRWMRYLPQDSDFPWDSYWKSLVTHMKKSIAMEALMRPHNGGPLKRIDQVRWLNSGVKDDKGEPIFEDIHPEIYLSKGFTSQTQHDLRDWGLNVPSINELHDRIEADLGRVTSRLKSSRSSAAWHSAAASLISFAFEQKWTTSIERVRGMRVIHLQNDRWVSAKGSQQLAFPTAEGRAIPIDLPLDIIDDKATANPERALLFRHLGARNFTAKEVRNMVLAKYPSVVNRRQLFASTTFGSSQQVLAVSLSHINFLYLTHDLVLHSQNEYRFVRVLTREGLLINPWSQDVYMVDDHKYSVSALLAGLPTFSVAFLDIEYSITLATDNKERQTEVSKKSWLQKSLNILNRPRLVKDNVITDLFRHLLNHRGNEVLGILQYYWKDIAKSVCDNQGIRDEIRAVPLSAGGTIAALSDCFLPSPELQHRALHYLGTEGIKKFPFLDLTNTLAPYDLSKWDFLHDAMGVVRDEEVSFYLKVLESVREQSPEPGTELATKVYALYEAIYRKIRAELDPKFRAALQREVSYFFSDGDVILIPESDHQPSIWLCPYELRWHAPPFMKTLYPAAHLFKEVSSRAEVDQSALEQFLRDTVQLGDCTVDDIIDELMYRARGKPEKDDHDTDEGEDEEEEEEDEEEIEVDNDRRLTTVKEAEYLYNYLEGLVSELSSSKRDKLVDNFQKHELIFASGSWNSAHNCLWSSGTDINGKVTLNKTYPDLKGFFVDVLGVKTLTLQMVFDELERMGRTGSCTPMVVKEKWKVFNSLLKQTEKRPDPKLLAKLRLFPVQTADGLELCSDLSPFAIIDRKPLGQSFQGEARLLDFTFEEVHQLDETLRWIGLSPRFLSVCVTEATKYMGQSAVIISNGNGCWMAKAHGLCRVATHFKSPKIKSGINLLYTVLKTAEISEVDGILAELQLQEGAKTIAVETKQSSLHFDDGGDALRIYVPRDQIQQQKCYVEALPRRLCEWLAGDGIKREASLESMRCKNIVMQILMVPHGIICSILDDAGIINIDIIDDFQPPVTQESIQNTSLLSQGQAPATESITTLSGGHQEPIALDGEVSNSDSVASVDKTITAESAVSAVSETSIATMPICQQPGDDTQSGASGSSVCYSSSLRTISSSYRHSSLSNLGPDNLGPPSTPFTYSPGRSEQVLVEPACAPDYIALLSQVINNASRAMLPRNDAYDFNRIRCALDQLDDHDDFAERIRFSTSSKLERDKMIGAAGELFVFELISRLVPELPGFGRRNWQSTIRKYVNRHPRYLDMLPWNGRETADIVYSDTEGVLTQLLIDHGYLDDEIWINRRPSYLIEVKTTTGPCKTPFYMSESQFKKMQATTNTSPTSSTDIYVIFRVSDLGTDSMNLAIYVDPEGMRLDQTLVFATKTYAVTLGPGGNLF